LAGRECGYNNRMCLCYNIQRRREWNVYRIVSHTFIHKMSIITTVIQCSREFSPCDAVYENIKQSFYVQKMRLLAADRSVYTAEIRRTWSTLFLIEWWIWFFKYSKYATHAIHIFFIFYQLTITTVWHKKLLWSY